ncbi:hypothetical protein BDN72DRAFT_898685 [Pluteus cervinus]|uniref:Uncharacterized protein n=1 Tax=Pluteus cervinus TaxID=181527 RepID=A0ACD3AQ36_9AGAR|nr:hypothetical protein BDN72DRAFT_898685 [Pluteus cervinus]
MMDVATTLPPELWLRIFNLLPYQDIRAMPITNISYNLEECPDFAQPSEFYEEVEQLTRLIKDAKACAIERAKRIDEETTKLTDLFGQEPVWQSKSIFAQNPTQLDPESLLVETLGKIEGLIRLVALESRVAERPGDTGFLIPTAIPFSGASIRSPSFSGAWNQSTGEEPERLLGQHVKMLKVLPSDYESTGQGHSRDTNLRIDAPTSIWLADPPIRRLFDLRKWKHPIRAIRHFTYSKRTLSTALAVLPHLIQLRVLVLAIWPRDVVNPNPKPVPGPLVEAPYTPPHRSYSQTTFPGLETFYLGTSLQPNEYNWDPEELEDAIRVIASTGRETVKFISLCDNNHPLLPLSVLLSGLGFFPKLVQLDFDCYRCDYDEPIKAPLTRFLECHRSSLERLHVDAYIRLFPRLPATRSDAPQSPKLTSLGLEYHVKPLMWSIGQPSLRSYANTLTTLVITSRFSSYDAPFAFSHRDLNTLVSSLYISPGGALLQRLQVPVMYLSPQIFDMLSNRLENLNTLNLPHHALVSNLGSEIKETAAFWQEMTNRTYSNWKIRRFYLSSPGDRYGLSPEEEEIMTRVIPSIESYSAGSWLDLRINSQLGLEDWVKGVLR